MTPAAYDAEMVAADAGPTGPAAPGTRSPFGALDGGRSAYLHWIGDDDVRLAVHELGAAVQSLWVRTPADGWRDVVVGGNLAAYTKRPPDFLGAVIGRVGNRISEAAFELDGRTYRVEANEGEHCLHGGPHGFHAQTWSVSAHTATSIELKLHSPDGDGGFPAHVDASVTYALLDQGVEVAITAVPSAPTPLALTQHSHFHLGDGGSAHDHTLQVQASRTTVVDADLIPTGELRAVDGSALDLRERVRIQDVNDAADEQVCLAGGLDHNYCLDIEQTGDLSGPAAVLRDPSSGLTLAVHTDQPGLQAYAGAFDGVSHTTGVALEPQHFPDAVNHRGEDGWPDPIATPEQPFSNTIRWVFTWT